MNNKRVELYQVYSAAELYEISQCYLIRVRFGMEYIHVHTLLIRTMPTPHARVCSKIICEFAIVSIYAATFGQIAALMAEIIIRNKKEKKLKLNEKKTKSFNFKLNSSCSLRTDSRLPLMIREKKKKTYGKVPTASTEPSRFKQSFARGFNGMRRN